MTSQIALVITTYNRELYLEQTLHSILQQTYADFQLLLWDDGSTDCTPNINHHFARQDPRIRAIAAPHLGRGPALARAVAETDSPFLGWVDSDDLLAPTALAETLDLLQRRPEVGMVYTNYLTIDRFGQTLGLGHRCNIPYSRDRLLVDFMTFHFRLIRREVYDRVGGLDPEFNAAQDYDLCLRLSEVTEIAHIPKPLYLWRTHRDSISQARQSEQIYFTERAIANALQRRGMSDDVELEVKLQPKFVLRRKRKDGPKVLGIGLGRTGTHSLQKALHHLGYKVLHEPRQLTDLDYVDGAVHPPIANTYPELDRHFPGSKFILTVREVDAWLASWEQYERRVRELCDGNVPDPVKHLRVQTFGQWEFHPDAWLAAYNRHWQQVGEHFQKRAADLLVLDICGGDGWKKLATFLEREIPTEPFPHDKSIAAVRAEQK